MKKGNPYPSKGGSAPSAITDKPVTLRFENYTELNISMDSPPVQCSPADGVYVTYGPGTTREVVIRATWNDYQSNNFTIKYDTKPKRKHRAKRAKK